MVADSEAGMISSVSGLGDQPNGKLIFSQLSGNRFNLKFRLLLHKGNVESKQFIIVLNCYAVVSMVTP